MVDNDIASVTADAACDALTFYDGMTELGQPLSYNIGR